MVTIVTDHVQGSGARLLHKVYIYFLKMAARRYGAKTPRHIYVRHAYMKRIGIHY